MEKKLPAISICAKYLLLVSVPSLLLGCSANTVADLPYSMVDDDTGRTVLLDTPAPLSLTPEGCLQSLGFGSHGYSVDWGDGSSAPDGLLKTDTQCQSYNRHRYKFPGTYTITVKRWDTGPTDEMIPLGTEQAVVKIERAAPKEETKITIDGQKAGKPHYRLPPSIVWQQRLGEPTALAFQIVGPGGEIFAEAQQKVTAFDGRGSLAVRPNEEQQELLSSALKQNPLLKANILIVGRDVEGEITYQDQQPLPITAERPKTTTLCPSRDYKKSGGMKLVISDKIRNTAYSFLIDWGDGSAPTKSEAGGAPARGIPKSYDQAVSFEHIYKKPGKYRVKYYLEAQDNPPDPDTLYEYCVIEYGAPWTK